MSISNQNLLDFIYHHHSSISSSYRRPLFNLHTNFQTLGIRCTPSIVASSSSSSSNASEWFRPRAPPPAAHDLYSDGRGEGIRVNAKENTDNNNNNNKKKRSKWWWWSRDRESYLKDDSEPLPLPMTCPDTSPVSPEEIEKRLLCDPQIEVRFRFFGFCFSFVFCWWYFGCCGKWRIAKQLFTNGLGNAGAVKGQVSLTIVIRRERILSANASLVWESVCAYLIPSILVPFWSNLPSIDVCSNNLQFNNTCSFLPP